MKDEVGSVGRVGRAARLLWRHDATGCVPHDAAAWWRDWSGGPMTLRCPACGESVATSEILPVVDPTAPTVPPPGMHNKNSMEPNK